MENTNAETITSLTDESSINEESLEDFYYDEIAGKDANEFVGQSEENSEVDTEENPQPQEESQVKEEDDSEVDTEVDTKVDVDVDKLRDEVKKELQQELTEQYAKQREEDNERLLKALGINKDEEDKYDYLIEPEWVKEKRDPKDWDEITRWQQDNANAIAKQAVEEYKKSLIEEEENRKKSEEEAEEQEKNNLQEWNTYWDNQLDTLVKNNRIPAMKPEIAKKHASGEPLTEEDRKDPGVKARLELFSLAEKHDNHSLIEVYHEYYKDINKQPAGEKAPVSVGKGTPVDKGNEEYDYDEIRRIAREKPWSRW